MKIPPICPYCGEESVLKDSSIIYGKSYGPMYICKNFPKCDSYVGVHRGTITPFGTMANSRLRLLRNRAHKALDSLWRTGKTTRYQCYKYLALKMKIKKSKAHIGMFDEKQCEKVVEIFSNVEPWEVREFQHKPGILKQILGRKVRA